jgi:serpin B
VVFVVGLCSFCLVAGSAWSFGWLQAPHRSNGNDPRCGTLKPTSGPSPIPTATPFTLPTPAPQECSPLPAYSQLVVSNNAFALSLFSELEGSYGPSANITFSPFSVSTALAMTWSGAQGQTAAQMASVLQYTQDPATVGGEYQSLLNSLSQTAVAGGLNLNIGDSLWLSTLPSISFSSAYLAQIQQDYSALETYLDFTNPTAAAGQINAWAAQVTQNMIPAILSPSDLNINNVPTAICLANAVYFKGPWVTAFNVSDTAQAPFTCAGGSVTSTAMMNLTTTLPYTQDQYAQVVELPYAGGDYSMVVILPNAQTGIAGLDAVLSPQRVNTWLQDLCLSQVQLSLPKMELNFGPQNLSNVLQGMGMSLAFTDQADFDGMQSGPTYDEFFIQTVKHQAVVEVTESGTKAAAATVVVVGCQNCMVAPMPLPPIVFNANHPFNFLIREQSTGTILFMAQVMDPNLK